MIYFNGIGLKNRFIVAAGPWSFYWKVWPFLDPSIFGAFTTNTFTRESREGRLGFIKLFDKKVIPEVWTVLRKIPNGWINAGGWRNPGIDWGIKKFYPYLKKKGANIIFSIGGFSVEEYLFLIEKLNPLDLSAIELNISCPNVDLVSDEFEFLEELFCKSKKKSQHPLIVKVGVDSDYLKIARFAEEYKINAINAINTIKGFHPGLKNGQGGISGRRIKQVRLEVVKKLKDNISIPIFVTGGIYSLKDCQYLLDTVASAVSFGSIFFSHPWKPGLIVKKAG